VKRVVPVLVLAVCAAVPVQARQARYTVAGAMLPVDHDANGFRQTVRITGAGTALVTVRTDLGPIGAAAAAFPAARGAARPGVPGWFKPPRALLDRLRPGQDAFARATEILRWTMRSIRVDDDDTLPQDAASVLRRRRGRCSGLANAAVALLRSLGFPARTVSGVLVGRRGPIAHRWLECRLPGAGWVPADPTLGPWLITPRHVVFAGPVSALPRIRLIGSSGGAVEALPMTPAGRMRPNRGAELVVRRVGGDATGPARVELRGPSGELRRGVLRAGGRFTNLRPGRWRLTIRVGGRVTERQLLDLAAGQVSSIAVKAGRPVEAG